MGANWGAFAIKPLVESSMNIRKAQKKDTRMIARIFREQMSKAPYRYKVSFNSALSGIQFYLKNYDVRVTCIDNKLVGFIAVFKYRWIDTYRLWVGELHVDSKYQKKGVGRALLDDVEIYYKQKRVKFVELLVNTKAPAIGFYEHLRFSKSPQQKFEKKL